MTSKTVTNACAIVQSQPEFATPVVTVTPGQAWTLAALAELITADPRHEPDWFCRQAATLAAQVPEPIAEQLRRFADIGSGLGFVVLRGLRCGEVPATPLNNLGAVGATTLLAKQAAILAHLAGDLVAYEAEGCGYLLQDMVPNPLLALTQESQGSKVELEAHTEQMFSPLRPDYVLLGCLRGDPDAATYVLDAVTLISHFTEAEVALIREPRWTTTIDASFQPFVPDPGELRGPWPILSGPTWDPTLLIDQDLMRGVDAAAQELLDRLIAVYLTERRTHTLVAGDVLLLDNLRAMHGRSPFTPRFDGTDRFVVRGFAVRDRRSRLPFTGADRRTVQARFS